MKKITLLLFTLLISVLGFSQNLVTNGNFQTGVATPWYGNAANVQDLGGGNWVNQANVVTANPTAPYVVNLSQEILLTSGKTYRFKFDAFTDATTGTRTIIAGLGQAGDPYLNSTSTVTLTSTLQTFTYDITITYGNAVNDRVIFDMGAATGFVFIDNVSVVEVLPLIQDFEAPATYIGLTQFGTAASAVVADPASAGTNGQVLRGTQLNSGDIWQGIVFFQTAKKAKLTTNKTMTIDVYSTQAFNLLARVENGGPGAPASTATSQAYTTPGQWQTLTFNFAINYDSPGIANGEYDKIAFHGNWNSTNTGYNSPPVAVTYYLDNIRSEFTEIVQAPSTAAPTPPARAAADVKSIFSNAYTPIAANLNYAGADGQPSNDNTFNTSWCGATTTLVQIAGNDTNRVMGLGCEGIAFLNARFDATSFTHFHMDVWTNSPTLDKSFNIKFSNWNGGTQETNALEYSMTNANVLTNPNPGTWYTFDIPLSSFTCVGPTVNPCPSRTDFTQFIITSNLGTVYYDNLYLHKNTTMSSDSFEVSKVKLYPNPTSNVLNIESLGTIQTISVYNVLGQEVINKALNSTSTSLDVSSLNSGIYVVKTVVDGVTSSTKFIKQ
jgi:hypothetical protein